MSPTSASLWDVLVPRRPRSLLLHCKRRLVFDDTSLISKRRRADVVVSDLAQMTVAGDGLSAHKCLKNLPVPRTLKIEEQDEPKDEESINESVVVGPQTPLPATKKRVSRRGGSLTNKQSRSISKAVINLEEDKLQEILELAENSVYYTRSINQQVSNAFKLVEVQGASCTSAQLKGHGQRVSIEGKKKPYQKNFKETNRAWKELLKKAIAESCEILMEKDDSILADDELQLFHEKVHSFASKVGAIQGKRVYFPWKGSVLDSVIGAFLTQRVSDNYSSSAFMSLGVSFPQYRDCDTYSRHHRMLREKRSIGGFFCQKQDLKGGHLKLGAESEKPFDEKKKETLRKGKARIMENIKPDWDTLKTQYSSNTETERSIDAVDYVDWHAVRRADMVDISNAIELRGMNKKLAKRIKEFLDRLLKDHGNLDLEWVRNVPPLQAKEFLLSIYGLGLKSAHCVQLLTLKQPAFPVDVNVARVTVRLGWVPAPPNTNDMLQMSVLEEDSKLHDLINHYLFPRLCKLDPKTLYELHYHMITFGKVFCTKQKPSCTECPMRKECKYYAEINIEDIGIMGRAKTQKKSVKAKKQQVLKSKNEKQKGLGIDHEQFYLEGNVEAPKTPVKDQPLRKKRQLGQYHSKATPLVGKQPQKIRTRTQHFVYELPDWHPILEQFDDRDPDDPFPYLLIAWESVAVAPLANSMLSAGVSHIAESRTVMGTVMIPCRTALRGSFPLNGTYFQINEVFADQKTSQMPIDVRCKTLQQLPRKILYCGRDLSNIVKGLSADEVKSLFNEGYICTRGFDRETLAPVTLERRLHALSKSKRRN